jgi:hypothetical protein
MVKALELREEARDGRARVELPFEYRLPLRIYVNNSISAVVIVGLALNALGTLFEPNVGPYALAVTWVLIQGGLIFVETLGAFLERPPEPRT